MYNTGMGIDKNCIIVIITSITIYLVFTQTVMLIHFIKSVTILVDSKSSSGRWYTINSGYRPKHHTSSNPATFQIFQATKRNPGPLKKGNRYKLESITYKQISTIHKRRASGPRQPPGSNVNVIDMINQIFPCRPWPCQPFKNASRAVSIFQPKNLAPLKASL